MKITIDEIKKISSYAKLIFTEDELEKMTRDFEKILNNFYIGDSLNLGDINLDNFDRVNSEFRKDEIEVFKDKKKLFRNSKSMREENIEVPKLIE
ncbi:Asp-tRNA(Asn)/Glu-tRNA(Gln) amidotransferase subunit GatC [Clostridium isatidis]|uniref:Asp-tRNA(Asn)/Glu-tRNA(Gln) amidotransferase subunit GatC n=1 Tax=Clostridium isatidis TaxID=182773 RepID=UPI003AAAD1DB